MVTSTQPAAAPPNGSPAAWQLADIDSPNFLYAVSCTRSGVCAAVDGVGRVLTSTEPTGGKPAWRARKISRNPLYAVSCASSRLCVALDSKGNVLSSAEPLGGASTWHGIRLGGSAYTLHSVSCPRPSLCVVGSDYARYAHSYYVSYAQVSVSTDPTGGPRAWRTIRLHSGDPVAISCPSAKLCVAAGGTELLTSTDPAGGPRDWKDAYLPGDHPRLTFTVGAGIPPGRAIKSVTLSPAPGISFSRSRQGVGVSDSKGRRLRFAAKLLRGGQLTITLAHPASRAQLTISGRALRAGSSLVGAVTQGNAGTLSFDLELTDAGRRRTTPPLMVKPS